MICNNSILILAYYFLMPMDTNNELLMEFCKVEYVWSRDGYASLNYYNMQLGAGDVQIPLSKCSIIIVHYSKMQVVSWSYIYVLSWDFLLWKNFPWESRELFFIKITVVWITYDAYVTMIFSHLSWVIQKKISNHGG